MGYRFRRIVSAATFVRLAISIVLAMFIWGFIVWETNPEVTREFAAVAVTPENVPADMLIVGSVPTVTVTLKGPQDIMRTVVASDVTASIDFSDVTSPGIDDYDVEAQTPSGVREVIIEPSTIEVELDLIVTRTFPTTLREDSPRPASVSAIDASTQIASVQGPQALVDQVDAVELVIDLGDQRESFTEEVPLVPVSETGNRVDGVVVSPSEVEFSVTFESTVKDVPVTVVCACIVDDQLEQIVLNNAAAIPSTIQISGPSSALESVSEARTVAIDISELDESGWILDVEIDSRAIPETVNYSDQTVDVWVQVNPERVEISDIPIKVLGLEPGLEAELSADSVTIIVTNSDEDFEEPGSLDLSAVVDLTDLSTGSYTVDVAVVVPPDVTYDQVFPRTVDVVLQPSSTSANRLREIDNAPTSGIR